MSRAHGIELACKEARASFVRLICSDASSGSQLGTSLQHLGATLDNLLQQLPNPYGTTSLSPLFGPFLARSILEVSCTAIVARIDPFRILTIGGAQAHASYDASAAAGLAFKWQGDVMSDEKQELWGTKIKTADVSRALLGQYQDKLFWQPAFERFLDYSNLASSTKDWTAELSNTPIKSFLPKFRNVAASVYSRSSKGVHHEYVLPPASYFDPASMQDLVDDTLRTALSLAVVATFAEQYCFRLDEQTAFNIFESLQP